MVVIVGVGAKHAAQMWEIPTGRGLEWFTAGNDARASVPTDDTKIRSLLDGSKTATIELVLDVKSADPSCSRLSYIGKTSGSGHFTLRSCSDSNVLFTVFGETDWGQWDLNWPSQGRHVLHLVLDTIHANASDRVKLYRNGVLLNQVSGTIYPDERRCCLQRCGIRASTRSRPLPRRAR